jgi:hypothetical protein
MRAVETCVLSTLIMGFFHSNAIVATEFMKLMAVASSTKFMPPASTSVQRELRE